MPLANASTTVSASEGFPSTSSPPSHTSSYNTKIGNFQSPQPTWFFCVTTALKHPLDQGHLLLLQPPEETLSGERTPVGVPAFARRTSTVSTCWRREYCRALHRSTTARGSRKFYIVRFETWYGRIGTGRGLLWRKRRLQPVVCIFLYAPRSSLHAFVIDPPTMVAPGRDTATDVRIK